MLGPLLQVEEEFLSSGHQLTSTSPPIFSFHRLSCREDSHSGNRNLVIFSLSIAERYTDAMRVSNVDFWR